MLCNLTFDQNLSKDDIFSLVDDFRTVNPNDTSHLEFETLPWRTGPTQNGEDVLYVQQPAASRRSSPGSRTSRRHRRRPPTR